MNHIEKCILSVYSYLVVWEQVSFAERLSWEMIYLYVVIPPLSGQVCGHLTTDCDDVFARNICRVNEQSCLDLCMVTPG